MPDGHVVRSLDGDQHYLLLEGKNAGTARLVLTIVEPIPAGDTMTESDWRLKYDTVDGIPALRVMRGDETSGVPLDPQKNNVYWFDAQGHLLQAYDSKLAIRYLKPADFAGMSVPREIVVRTSSVGVALKLTVDELSGVDPASLPKNEFKVGGYEWKRQFTAEVR